MSPSQALANPAFRYWVLLIAGTLGGAGVVLAVLALGLRKDLGKVWRIYRSWLVMAPLALGALLAGRYAFVGFIGVLSLAAFNEYAKATGLYRDWVLTACAFLAIGAAAAAGAMPDLDAGGLRTGWFDLFQAMPVYAVGLFLVVPIFRNRAQGQLQLVALAIVGFVYVGWMFMHLGFLANVPNPYGPIIYLVFATEVSDVAAYTFGRLFGRPGRHPLRSNISPNKTWEGAIGALAVSLALPWAVRFSFPPEFGPGHLLLTGLIVGVGGQLGDLSISLIKREVGIKDMGATIPGHGGILDRIDSLIFTAPLFLRLVHFVEPVR